MGLFWHSKHSLAPVFTANGSMDSGNSYSDRFLFQPEKSEKKPGKTCNKFTTDVSVNFANSTVHFSQCCGHDIFLHQLEIVIYLLNFKIGKQNGKAKIFT
jgi:hypothetical protein